MYPGGANPEENTMRNAQRLFAVIAVGATALVAMFHTALAQAPPTLRGCKTP
jgi:hypothetical protein